MKISEAFNNQFCVLALKYGLKGGDLCQNMIKIQDLKRPSAWDFDLVRIALIALCGNGLYTSLLAFVRFCMNKNPKTGTVWFNNRFCVLPREVPVLMKSINMLLHLNSWIFLSYGTYNYSPELMVPWLTYHCALLMIYVGKIVLKVAIAQLDWKKDVKKLVLFFKMLSIAFVYSNMHYYDIIRRGSIN